MRINDPHLVSVGVVEVEWKDGLDKTEVTKRMLDLLASLAELLHDSGVPFEEGAVAQVQDQIVLVRHFLSRLPHIYGADGLCQEFYRLSCLDNDFDYFGDEEVNSVISEVVSLAKQSIVVKPI